MVSVDKLLKIKTRYPEDNQITFVSFFQWCFVIDLTVTMFFIDLTVPLQDRHSVNKKL